MAHYPDTPVFTGTLRPMRFEGDIHDVEVEGELPPQLQWQPIIVCTRTRNSRRGSPTTSSQWRRYDRPVPLSRRQARLPSALCSNGQMGSSNARLSARCSAPIATRSPMSPPCRQYPRHGQHQRSGARRQTVRAQGGQSALLMDPLSLDTEGYTDFGGKMQGATFCAHPKIDPLPAICAPSAMRRRAC